MNLFSPDKNLFLLINSFVGKFPLLDNLVKLVVNEYFVPVSLALVLLYLWFAPSKSQDKHRESLPLAAYSIGIANLIIEIVNKIILRPRPFDEMSVNLLFYRPTDPSFPANAAVVGAALATSIFLVNKKWGVFATALATIYGFSRVYAGVHYPVDVLAGFLLGFVSAILLSKLNMVVEKTGKVIEDVQSRLGLDLN